MLSACWEYGSIPCARAYAERLAWRPWPNSLGRGRDMPFVIIVEGEGKGTRFKLSDGGAQYVGRADECQIRLPDLAASKQHCVLEADGDSWLLRDAGSRNGTRVNGRQVTQVALKPGDEIEVGQTTLRFVSDDAVATADASTAVTGKRLGQSSRAHAETQPVPALVDAQQRHPEAAEGDALVGRALGDYRLVSRIGAGAMGCVYRAIQVSQKKAVAVKVLAEELTRDEAAIRRFVRSAKTALKLTHPNMVAVYGAWRVRDVYFLTMEFVEGQDLGDMLECRGPGKGLDPKVGLDITIQVAHALHHAHQHGVVHRDIKPGNILIRTDGVAKLADVCLIKSLNDAGIQTGTTESGVGMGTMDYMAPEQMLDAKHVDARADLYSLGVTLYHALSGMVPFPGVSRGEKVESILEGRFTPVRSAAPHVPEFFVRVIEKAIAREPEARYQTADDMIAALSQARRMV